MSFQAMAWAVKQHIPSAGAKLVLIMLANYADEHGCCWPSQKCLGKDSSQSDRSVRSHMALLEKIGVITRQKRTGNNGAFLPDICTLAMKESHQRKILPTENSTDGKKRHNPAENISANTINEPIKESLSTRARGKRLSIEELPDEWRAFCLAERSDLDPERVWAIFHDHWDSTPGQRGIKRDWFATWRNWVRREKREKGGKIGRNCGISEAERRRRILSGMEAAAREQHAGPKECGSGGENGTGKPQVRAGSGG